MTNHLLFLFTLILNCLSRELLNHVTYVVRFRIYQYPVSSLSNSYSKSGFTQRLSLVPSPYLHAREMVWCTNFKYLALFPKMRNVQSNCRMITSSHRNEIATYHVRGWIIPCVEAGHPIQELEVSF